MVDVTGTRSPMHKTSLPRTKAPTKTRPMESKKTMVATTRTGLNIYERQEINSRRLQQNGWAKTDEFKLSEELRTPAYQINVGEH